MFQKVKTYQIYMHIFLFVFTFGAAILITEKVISGGTPLLDKWSQQYISGFKGTWYFVTFRWVTELGSYTFLAPLVIVVSLILWKKQNDLLASIMFVTGSLVGTMIMRLMKHLVGRQRPEVIANYDAVGYSFPSGHAMLSVVIYGLIAYFFIRYVKAFSHMLFILIGSSLLIFAIGISRYILNVHYMTDILGGFSFGYIFLIIWILLHQLIIKIRIKNKDSV